MQNAAENAQDITNLEQSIDRARLDIKRKDALERLENNADFKMLITDGFLQEHAVRQVMLKAHPGLMQNANALAQVDQQITAVGGFKQFLIGIYSQGCEAEQALTADEATLEELLAEGIDA